MRILIVLALVGLSLTSLQSDEPKPKPPQAVLPVGDDFVPSAYLGRVVNVTEETVTIKPEGDLKIGSISFHPDGTIKEERLYIQDNTKPPQTFVFSDGLHWYNGTLPAARRAGLVLTPHSGLHKISDLRPGDFVFINSYRRQGIDYCAEILIQRRPGGQVPLTIGDDKLPVKDRIATGYNDAQAREEMMIATFKQFGLRLSR
ncbi:MAG: hypothetical protein L0241_28915 [Planctomycetia bacterium]|nr:hypothetical protein [Planctomycetia bacterium]